MSLSIPSGKILVTVLDQGRPHGIPTTGDSISIYFSVLSREKFANYAAATMARLAKMAHKPPARPQHWVPLEALGSYQLVAAATLLLGTRPVLFPSGKVLSLPQPFNASRYKLFTRGYYQPPQDAHDLATVLQSIRDLHGDEVASPFLSFVLQFTGGHHNTESELPIPPGMIYCAKDPSQLSTDTLCRYLDIPLPGKADHTVPDNSYAAYYCKFPCGEKYCPFCR